MNELVRDLRNSGMDLIETHISWVFLRGGEVWKIKKPVDLGFLDFSTLEKRRAACEAEVRLNRRLAPHAYLGVVPVTLGPDGRHRLAGEETLVDGEETAIDWAVHMRRLPDALRADHLCKGNLLEIEDVERLADQIAAFHEAARYDDQTARFGTSEVVSMNVEENFEQTSDTVFDYLAPQEVREVRSWQTSFIEEHRPLFRRRIREGRVRDGHGDLRLEHCYRRADGGFTILDCIEFNDRLRFADVCADLAFLAMDLEWHGRVDLAEAFLARYAQSTGDYDLFSLVDFYASYRAWVRAKISSIVAADTDIDFPVRERARREARSYYLLSLACARRSIQQPTIIAVGGLIASGKTTVAEALAVKLGAPVVSADRTRKDLLGVAPTTALHDLPWQGAYSPEMTERVYAEVVERGKAVLQSGRSVILDASFRSRRSRAKVRALARECRVSFLFVECRVDPETCRHRLEERTPDATPSDGRLEIFDDFLAHWEPTSELPRNQLRVIDTSQSLEDNLARLATTLPFWPQGLTA